MNQLKLITPPHLKIAEKITEKDIDIVIETEKQILEMIKDGSIYEPGSKYNNCAAVAQPQISDKPLRFFTLNPDYHYLVEEFGAITIINPRLVSKDRGSRLVHKEGCLSYQSRPVKKVKRFLKIIVEYSILDKGRKLKQVDNKSLSDFSAMVFQHEMEHLNGKSIWAK